MDSLIVILALVGAISLLLWGTHMVQSGVQRAFGPRLRTVLADTLDNRIKALLAGIGITVVLQSSTATALMATNFTSAGLIGLLPAMAVMLGANVGTALIVTLLSFNVAILSAPLITIGLILFRLDKDSRRHDLGRVLIGLGLMLLALHQLVLALEPVAQSTEVMTLLGLLGAMPLVAVILGTLLAWAMHSSVAVVLLVGSLATHGIVGHESALLLVLGANLGTALNPLLEAGDKSPSARRMPLFNLGNRLLGLAIAWLALPQISVALSAMNLPDGADVAVFHLGFNFAMALIALPFLPQIAVWMCRLLPDRQDAADPAQPIYLDHSALDIPMIALGGAQREALRLADTLEAMLNGAREVLVHNERKLLAETRARDDVLDSLNTHIKRYLAQVDEDDLGEDDKERLHRILVFVMNMEQAGDVIDRHLLLHATKRLKRGLLPDADNEEELTAILDRLIANTRTAASLFVTEDAQVARKLAEEKALFRRVEQDATTRHFALMRDGVTAASQSSALHLDLLRDLKLANSFVVAAAAYPVLDRAGELLPSRMASTIG
ncbi:Na/Pi cotransporter [Devosia soli]|uniref:Na/Pi cotransporter n=1 Tax=Devosia soli TaxID=361041 RepID=A0A0F5L0F6_9HYPH|nr:Na/Pi cotransporter family protein [Devosia soli]KKB75858.1 Na/Pi cotransporter [Devosia soli]